MATVRTVVGSSLTNYSSDFCIFPQTLLLQSQIGYITVKTATWHAVVISMLITLDLPTGNEHIVHNAVLFLAPLGAVITDFLTPLLSYSPSVFYACFLNVTSK